MVHALREAHRVLKPNSLLIDLRPAAIHRQVGIVRAGCYQLLGTMREKLGDDRAANRAVAQVECRRVMDSLGDLRTFIDEFYTLGADLPPHDWLIQRVNRALDATRGKKQIVVSGPLV